MPNVVYLHKFIEELRPFCCCCQDLKQYKKITFAMHSAFVQKKQKTLKFDGRRLYSIKMPPNDESNVEPHSHCAFSYT